MNREEKKIGDKIETKHYQGKNFIEKTFEVEKVLGKGRSSIVYLVRYLEDNKYLKLGVLKEFNPIDEEREEDFLLGYSKQCDFANKIEKGINITTKAEGIYRDKNTVYILMEIDKGQIYSDIKEESLEELIKTIIAIGKGVKVYHKEGYVHLDIKPDNILILDETREIVKFFDFDSIQKLENISSEKLLFTGTFAAPELLHEEKNYNIGYETDIYSIGLILFYKIFNRLPERKEKNRFSKIDFNKESPLFKGVSPRIFDLLNNFFRKTININWNLRFSSIDEMLEELDKILKIARKDNKVLLDLRLAKFEKSLGREEEKKYIHKLLKENGTVFIKGVGGIGKTELAKMYIDEYKEEYNTIQFITFNGSLKNTIAKELKYSNLDDYEYIKKNDIEALFEEKLKLLNEEDEKVLLIIDNFNVDYDEKLEFFINRKLDRYKIIFTTRNYFEEFEEVYLKLNHLEESIAKNLFLNLYRGRNIKEDEKKDIEKILKIIGYNTLMIKLIALNCRDQRKKPRVILENLKNRKIGEIEGKIRHDDGDRLMYEHLNAVFQVLDLKKNYKLVLKTMSLIGNIKINASFFKELMDLENFDSINELVSLGWLEIDIERDMLYIHEVISSVINEKLEPTDIECGKFIQNLTEKLKEGDKIYKIREMYFDFAKKIEERLKIESYIGGEFLLVLADRTIESKKAKKYIVKAEKIYLESKEMKKIYLLYIRFYLERLCSIEFFERGKKMLLKIRKYEMKILNNFEKVEIEDYKELRKIYFNKLSNMNLFLTEQECLEYAKHIEDLFLTEEIERKKIQDTEGLSQLYEDITWFYGDFSNPIQNEKKGKLYEIKKENKEISEDELIELGNAARMNGDIEEALEYYKLGAKIEKAHFKADTYEDILQGYIELKRYDEAIVYSEEIELLDYEKGYILYLLGKIYGNVGEKSKAKENFNKSIEASYIAIEKEKYSEKYNYKIIGKSFYRLGELEIDKEAKLKLYNEAKKIVKDEYIKGLNESIGDIKNEEKYYIRELKEIEKEWQIDTNRVINIFEKISKRKSENYLLIGHIFIKGNEPKKAREYYKQGLEKEENSVLKNIFLKRIGDTYREELETEKACEYYKKSNIMEVAIFNIEGLCNEEISERFIDAGDVYNYIDNYDKAIKSYKKAIEYLNGLEHREKIIKLYKEIERQYEYKNDYEEVKEYKLKRLELKVGQEEEKEIGEIYFEIGEIEEKLKNIKAAEKNYKDALDIFRKEEKISLTIKTLEKLCLIKECREKYIEDLKDIINLELEV